LAKPNYQYEKRQKDLAKKRKKEEKRLKKLGGKTEPGETPAPDGETPAEPQGGGETPTA